jgi:alkylation response protein AidB-like acyl-CoA dehydrogenase
MVERDGFVHDRTHDTAHVGTTDAPGSVPSHARNLQYDRLPVNVRRAGLGWIEDSPHARRSKEKTIVIDLGPLVRRLGLPLGSEHHLVLDTARELAERRLAPGAAERDRTGCYPARELAELSALGLHAVKVDESHGGPGIDNVGYALVMAATASACASTAVCLASTNLAGKLLSDLATDEQRQRWLAPYLRGELGPASFALSEPGCGSDAAALVTRARLDGGSWVLDGQKMWITNATHAGVHLVFARSDGAGRNGISCFLVPRDAPGVVVGKEEDKMGQRASGTAALTLEGCRVSAGNLLGARGQGYRAALGALGAGRVGIAGLSLGIGEAALAAGVAYAKERHAFGQPIVSFQNTEFVLADCRMELDAAWLLTLRAARLLDAGQRALAETSMAKLFASETACRVVDRMLQLHGGYGYSKELEIERLYRDVRVTRIYEGTSEVHRIVVARELLRART